MLLRYADDRVCELLDVHLETDRNLAADLDGPITRLPALQAAKPCAPASGQSSHTGSRENRASDSPYESGAPPWVGLTVPSTSSVTGSCRVTGLPSSFAMTLASAFAGRPASGPSPCPCLRSPQRFSSSILTSVTLAIMACRGSSPEPGRSLTVCERATCSHRTIYRLLINRHRKSRRKGY